MADVKKLLVAFDPKNPDAPSSDFLVPWFQAGLPVLRGLKSGKSRAQGMVVHVGRVISENDLFAKLIDSGAFIPDVDKTLETFREYLRQLQGLRIGDVVEVIAGENADGGFQLRPNRKPE